MAYSPELKARARQLRFTERRSLNEITKALNVPKGTLSLWLRDLPLTTKERSDRRSVNLQGNDLRYKSRGEQSKHHASINARALTSEQKARIAEAAILFRLALHGIETYGRVFDGQQSDWLGLSIRGAAIRIQVRWAGTDKHGLPRASLRRSEGQKRISGFDFLVVYNLYTDTAYVLSRAEIVGLRSCVTIRPAAAEAFWKLRQPVAQWQRARSGTARSVVRSHSG